MDGTEKRHCSDCGNYRALVNHGYWWCDAGHTGNMDPETCCDYDRIAGEITTSCTCGTYMYQDSGR